MNSSERKERFVSFVAEYQRFKDDGKLDLTSEETIRTWLNQLLSIFDWDVRDTSQVLQEKVLSMPERQRLTEISSQNTRPDYSFRIARQKLTFLDAKDVTVSIKDDDEAAFQIKSYGWSILAPCAFISNLEEFAIYDCTYVPEKGQDVNLGRIYLRLDEYIDNYEVFEAHLLKENIYKGRLNQMYSATLTEHTFIQKVTPDLRFAEILSNFRIALATDILTRNSIFIGNNSAILSYIVQIIINRILFVRVCEARRIEDENLLLSFHERGFWDSFKESSYLEFYEHYDGHLFDRLNEIHRMEISNTVFDQLLCQLYYPSPYRFDVIPTKLLSDIYEIFLSRRLIIQDGHVRDEIKNEYLKTRGAVSTPHYIVEEIVRRTIPKERLIGAGISQLFSNKILDVACGSGVFAIEAYDYLEECFKELFITSKDGEFSRYFVVTEDDVIINLQGKKAIIENCIFGVDIDPEAVEVTKMSLCLKMVEATDYLEAYSAIGIFGTRILNGIGNNIRCGNSLVESDIIEMYPELTTNREELIKTNIFDWHSRNGFGEIFAHKNGFDYIVGNPPYVEVRNYNVDLPYMHKYIKRKFPSASNGKVDLAIPFIERGIQLLNPAGRLGFIVQRRFFKTDYGKKIRDLIATYRYLSSIVSIESTSIFKGRITYVALMFLDRSSPEEFMYRHFTSDPETLAADLRESPPPEYVRFSATSVTSNAWNFDDVQLIQIRTRLNNLGTLGDFATVRVGIQSLWNEAYHIRPISVRNGIITGRSSLETNLEIEVAACCALLPNENFYSFRSDTPETYCIFPYEVSDEGARAIEFDTFASQFPLAGAYLRRNKRLIQSTVETLPGDRWHLFTRANNIARNFAKVYIPMTAQDTFAAVTFSARHYCDNANVNYLELPEITAQNLYALASVINSTVFSVLARSIANPQAGGYFKFNKQFLEPVPFPVERFQSDTRIVSELAENGRQIEGLNRRFVHSAPSERATIVALLQRLWRRVDQLCFTLYELSDEECQIISIRGRNAERIEML